MQKKFIYMLIIVLSLSISICSAAKSFNAEQAAIGGIAAGSSTDYIKGIYGEPNKIRIRENHSETWYYGDTFQIDFINGKVSSVVSSGNNGLATPAGITVGMKKSKMTSNYGSPQVTDKYGNRAIYTYQADNGVKMIFIISNGIISEIRVN